MHDHRLLLLSRPYDPQRPGFSCHFLDLMNVISEPTWTYSSLSSYWNFFGSVVIVTGPISAEEWQKDAVWLIWPQAQVCIWWITESIFLFLVSLNSSVEPNISFGKCSRMSRLKCHNMNCWGEFPERRYIYLTERGKDKEWNVRKIHTERQVMEEKHKRNNKGAMMTVIIWWSVILLSSIQPSFTPEGVFALINNRSSGNTSDTDASKLLSSASWKRFSTTDDNW